MPRPKVLLVDDSELVRAVVAHTLGASEYDVACIDDPRALAVEIARFEPDLLLVDASYPGVTDEVLVALVGAHAKTVPVVLFSDRSDAEVTSLVGRIGARGSVPKEGATLAARLAPYL